MMKFSRGKMITAMDLRAKLIACCLCVWVTSLSVQVNAQDKPIEPLSTSVVAEVTSQFDPAIVGRVDELVDEGLADKKMPGCVICFGRSDGIAFLKAYGDKQVEPDHVPMTVDTVFDMASITKPVATATSIMLLLERGQLRLTDKVTDYIPEFAANEKGDITIRDLLTHQSGLLPDNSIKDYDQGPAVALQKINELKLQNPIGSKFVYSDVNFILLGDLVKRISGKDVNEFSRENIFTPLQMLESGYLPAKELRERAAPTEKRDGEWMRGEVHDPRAYALGGVAGHAGLFSTATDLSKYARVMIQGGKAEGAQLMKPETFDLMTRPYRVSSGLRGLGWDKLSGYSSNRGDFFSERAFGHGGFTGTVLWIDPQKDLFFIFLSNRVHPDGKGSVNQLAGRIATVIGSALRAGSRPAPRVLTQVSTGIDMLVAEHFRQLKGRKLGLITNHTGRSRSGKSTVELLHEAEGVDLKVLFSPEHGFAGQLDVSKIGDTQDPTTGLKVYSLYGETRRPKPEQLAEIDTLVFDIQDIGTRFYTYVSTMGEAMRAASEAKIRFVVLDRPNPIGGIEVSGPMLDDGRESFVGYHKLPVRHGMTAGELAKMFRDEFKLELDLQVIECDGWKREQLFDDTGLIWVNPSPNMRSLTEAILYPGIGLLETTNVSVGRGTDTPFEIVGAPWIDGVKLAAKLREFSLRGVTFVPYEFIPTSSKFEKQKCGGVQIQITDRGAFKPLETGFAFALALKQLYPKEWESKGYMRLLGNEKVHRLVDEQASLDEILQASDEGVREFMTRRAMYRIY